MTLLAIGGAAIVVGFIAWARGSKYNAPHINPNDRINDPKTGVRH